MEGIASPISALNEEIKVNILKMTGLVEINQAIFILTFEEIGFFIYI